MSSDPSFKQFAMISGSAFLGSLFRYKRWLDNGRLVWWRILLDLPGSAAFGIMSVGLSFYLWKNEVSVWVVAGLAGFLGMLGPDVIGTAIERWTGGKDK